MKKRQNFTLTPELARIVAHICGDGYVYMSRQRRTPKELLSHSRKNLIRVSYGVRYVNTEKVLVNQFISDVNIVFRRKVTPLQKCDFDLSGKWIQKILVDLGAGKSHKWFISQKIFSSKQSVKIEWLKAFFDDEAHVSVPQKRIVLNIVNKNGLLQIQKLLREFGVVSHLGGPYICRSYYSYHLTIYSSNVKSYSETIGFYHPKKVRDLHLIIK